MESGTGAVVKPGLRAVVSLDRARAARAVARGGAPGSLAEAFEHFKARKQWTLPAGKGGLARSTRDSYQTAMTLVATFAELKKLPAVLEVSDFEDWQAWLVEARGLAPATVNCYRRSLKAVLEAAARKTHDHRLADAIADAAPLKEAPPKKRNPPADAYARAESACRDEAEMLFLRLTTIMRVGEVCGLVAADLSPSGVLHIERQRDASNGDVGARKNRRPYDVRLGPVTIAMFRRVASQGHELRSRTGSHKGHVNGFVFPWASTRIGNFLERIRQAFGADVESYMPKGDAWHVMRHFGATVVSRETGGDLARVRNILGDKSSSIAQYYVDDFRGTTQGDAELIERAMERGRQMALPGSGEGPKPGRGDGSLQATVTAGSDVTASRAHPSLTLDSVTEGHGPNGVGTITSGCVNPISSGETES